MFGPTAKVDLALVWMWIKVKSAFDGFLKEFCQKQKPSCFFTGQEKPIRVKSLISL